MGVFELARYDDGSLFVVNFNDSNRRATSVTCVNFAQIPTTIAGIRGWLKLPNGSIVSQTWFKNDPAGETTALPANNGITVETVQNEPGDPPGTHLELTGTHDFGIEVLG